MERMGWFDDLAFFTAAVDAGSFAGAARRLRVTPSAVSRRVAQLERTLGAELLTRTTRSLRLTDDGRAFYERCGRALGELREARDALARTSRAPAGVLRVDAGVALGRELLVPRMPELLARYPAIGLELTLRDQLVDPLAEGLDVVVRIGPLRDSSLVARRLGESRLAVCASPAYLRRRGVPKRPTDLARHDCIGYLRDGRPQPFRFAGDGGVVQAIEIAGRCHGNDADTIRQLAIAGHGIAAVFDFYVAAAFASGALVPLLAEYAPESWPIHALYPRNRHLVPRVAVFLDFLAEIFGQARRPPARSGASRSAASRGAARSSRR
jgi:LysR family transcriptional regulator for bpeEF and oprC